MYGIEVYSKKGYGELTQQEWSEIKAAIGSWMLENEDGNSNTVYVEPMDAGKAIRALNAIGFTTDEDYFVADDDPDNDDDDDDDGPQPAPEAPAPASVPAELIEALTTREACLGGMYMSAKQATEQHLDLIADGCYTKAQRQAAVANEKRLLALGNQYFEQGYRLKKSPRQVRGTVYRVPSEAIVHDLQGAGHIAMAEAFRVVYVIKK